MPGVNKGKSGVLEVCAGQYRPIAYTVRFKNGHCVGVVEDIIDLEYVCQLWVADEVSIPLLRHNAQEADQFETVVEKHTVHHRIPLVQEFILDVDSKARSITVKLPAGLINLGREELYIRVLKRELEPYIAHLPNRFREKVRGERELPRYNDLRKEGRTDLVSLIKQAGGLAKVAQTLGCRTAFRPRGYFQDLDNLDWDLSCFIASGWVKLPTCLDPLITAQPDSDDPSATRTSDATEVPDSRPRPGATDNQHEIQKDVSVEADSPIIPKANDLTTTPTTALLSLDCGDELLEDEDRELCELDHMATHASGEYMSMTTITHAGKVQLVGINSSIALYAGYDAPDYGYASALSEDCSASAPSTISNNPDHSLDDCGPDADEDWFVEDGDDDMDELDEGEWPDFDEMVSANSVVGEWYYFNTITQQVSLEEPQVPSVHRVGQALVRVEDESQRYMPPQASLEEGVSRYQSSPYQSYHALVAIPKNTLNESVLASTSPKNSPRANDVPGCLCTSCGHKLQAKEDQNLCMYAAGRNDLLNAIRLHGGFQVVADALQRDRLFTRRPVVTDRDVILRKVQRVQQTLGLPSDEFPTREQLEACQMPHVVCWITSAGGFRKVALELGMRTRRMMSQITPEGVAEELADFMQHHLPPPGEERLSGQGEMSHRWRYLPSLQHLRREGCKGLALKLKRSDTGDIARLLGVEPRKRGWPKGRPRKHNPRHALEVQQRLSRAPVKSGVVARACHLGAAATHAMVCVSKRSRVCRSGAAIRVVRRPFLCMFW